MDIYPGVLSDPDELYKEAQQYVKAGETKQAMAKLQNLIREFPGDARAHNDLGVLLYNKGDKEKAQFHYEKAVSLNPGNPTFLKNLADFYYVELKRVNEAANLYKKVLSIRPQDIESLLILGNIHVEIGKFHNAKAYYLKALEIDPANELALQMVEALKGRQQEAGADLGTGL